MNSDEYSGDSQARLAVCLSIGMEPAFRNSVLSRKEKESKYFRQSRSRAVPTKMEALYKCLEWGLLT